MCIPVAGNVCNRLCGAEYVLSHVYLYACMREPCLYGCMQASLWLVVSAAASVLLGIAFLQLFKHQPHLMTKATIASQVN